MRATPSLIDRDHDQVSWPILHLRFSSSCALHLTVRRVLLAIVETAYNESHGNGSCGANRELNRQLRIACRLLPTPSTPASRSLQTTARSATDPDPIHIFSPVKRFSLPLRRARVVIVHRIRIEARLGEVPRVAADEDFLLAQIAAPICCRRTNS